MSYVVPLLSIGSYCDYDEAIAAGDLGVVTPLVCPKGFYCPLGTNYSSEHPCPRGTYSNSDGLTSQDLCTPCDEGITLNKFPDIWAFSYDNLGLSSSL